MSFMFNPYPYFDPKAVNQIEVDNLYTDMIVEGSKSCADEIISMALKKDAKIIGIDGYIGSPFNETLAMIKQSAADSEIELFSINSDILYKDADIIENELSGNLPLDLDTDPVLLYGELFDGSYEDLMDESKIDKTLKELEEFKKDGKGIFILYGNGSLIRKFRNIFDIKIFIDITPIKVVLNAKSGKIKNLGDNRARTYKALMRRCYYVDFELSMKLRGELIKDGFDFYIQGDNPEMLKLAPYECILAIFDSLVCYPFRCRPVYLEGIWGGHYIYQR